MEWDENHRSYFVGCMLLDNNDVKRKIEERKSVDSLFRIGDVVDYV